MSIVLVVILLLSSLSNTTGKEVHYKLSHSLTTRRSTLDLIVPAVELFLYVSILYPHHHEIVITTYYSPPHPYSPCVDDDDDDGGGEVALAKLVLVV